MLTIELRFPTGKWHATPWGRQVNEGAVEWPPSPWRLLRALVAVWHHKLHDVPEEEMRPLIGALIAPPVYSLPHTSEGHTRHYMPVANDKRAKIFDTFLSLSPSEPVLMGWPGLTLNDSQRNLLERLLSAMSYFGRAESWVLASLSDWEGENPSLTAKPLDEQGVGPTQELVRLLAPVDTDLYSQWRTQMADELGRRRLTEKQDKAASKGKSPEKETLTKSDLKKIDESLPHDLYECLHSETDDLRKAGWNQPPGSQWIEYVRDRQVPQLQIRRPHSQQTKPSDPPTVARYAIAGSVRPRLTEALWIGERVRTSLIKISDGDLLFVGRNSEKSEGQPAKGHQHAHFLCESNNDSRGRITHLTVFAPAGFSEENLNALQRLHRTWGQGGHDLQFVLLGAGCSSDFGGMNMVKGQSPILAASSVWESRTPFVPADRLRQRYNFDDPTDRHRCELDLARMVRAGFRRRTWLDFDALDRVEAILDPEIAGVGLGGRRTSWLKFRRDRQSGGGRRGHPSGFGLRLHFSRQIQGPIVLGYGAHFGLGQFVPATSAPDGC